MLTTLKNIFEIKLRSFFYGIPMALIFIGFINLEDILCKKKSFILDTLNKIGDSSYSLYLAHPFIIGLFTIIFTTTGLNSSVLFFIAATASSIYISYYIYKIIELPIDTNLKKHFK